MHGTVFTIIGLGGGFPMEPEKNNVDPAKEKPTPEKKGFFATFYKRSLNERFLIIFLLTACLIALMTLVLICLSINDMFPEDMNKFDNGGGEMNWYGYIIAVAIILCVELGMFAAIKQGYYSDLVFDYVIFAVPCAFIGAILYYGISNIIGTKNLSELTFNEILGKFGGLAVIGGLFGAAVGIVLAMLFWQNLMKHPKVSISQLLDIAAPFVLLGQCIGRFGCYFAHCCYGIEVDFALFPFSYSYDNGVTYHLGNPFIESIWCFIMFVPLLALRLSDKKCFNGFFISVYCIWYGIGRCTLEAFREGDQKLQLMGGHGDGFGVSQFTSILMIAAGVIWIAQYIIRAVLARKKIMIAVDKDKLNDEYFEYNKTIYAHPHVDAEGNPIKTPDVSADTKGDENDG